MLVKDLTETAGVARRSRRARSRSTSRLADAAVVRRMKDAGFIVLGKSNTPEFGITRDHRIGPERRVPQPVGHLAHARRLVGWRAGAVAAGVLPLAHGSDGGGSVRIPATCCGLFGIKPSRGRVSPAPYVSRRLKRHREHALRHPSPHAATLCPRSRWNPALASSMYQSHSSPQMKW